MSCLELSTFNNIFDSLKSFFIWFTTTEASQLGSFLTGLAAILALLLSPLGIKFWRKQKHEEKSSEVAQSAYARSYRFLHSIANITNSTSFESVEKKETSTNRVYSFAPIFYERLKKSDKNIQDFLEIWPDVESILSRDASELFSEIWSHWVDIQVNFETLCMMYNQGLELKEIDKDYMDKSIGKTARKKNEDLILKAKIIFPPMAQFKSKSNSPNNQPPGPASPTDTKKDK